MSSFQAKIVWKRQRKRENKNPHSVPFRSRRVRENFKNIGKKLKKLKKYHYSFISGQNLL